MKIYQVEELVGITKKNIRFYEDKGLLNPDRNPENDYREYSLADVHILEKIKLLRKLNVPIEEIKLLQNGKLSISQCMLQQIESFENEEKNAQIMKEFCERLKNETEDVNSLDASKYLMEMDKMEKQGTKFTDIENQDINRKKKTGAIVGAAIFITLILLVFGSLIHLIVTQSIPILPVLIPGIIFIGMLVGTLVMLFQRIKEIDSNEEFEARKY